MHVRNRTTQAPPATGPLSGLRRRVLVAGACLALAVGAAACSPSSTGAPGLTTGPGGGGGTGGSSAPGGSSGGADASMAVPGAS